MKDFKEMLMVGRIKFVSVLVCLMTSTYVYAGNSFLMSGVSFGKSQTEVSTALKNLYGNVGKQTANGLIYNNVSFRGIDFDVAEFNFKEDKLVEARFAIASKTRQEAIAAMDSIANEMKKSYGVSKDKEDHGSWFYVGGISPRGIGHAFTIFTYRKQGIYYSELRYGPFATNYFE